MSENTKISIDKMCIRDRNIIGSGHQMDSKEFQALSQMISDDSQIIKVIEQAPDGVVKDIYPLKGNEAAFGIDMLNNPARKHEANLAMKSGQYTICLLYTSYHIYL